MFVDPRSLECESIVAHGGVAPMEMARVTDIPGFQGTLDFIIFARIPPGSSVGLHKHGANEEIYVILSGSGLMHLDGSEYRVRPGHILVNPPFGEHGLLNDGDAPIEFLAFQTAARKDEG